ncbi:MAG: hypothetical protein ABSG56_20860 [Bryobacteraceae bacterium]
MPVADGDINQKAILQPCLVKMIADLLIFLVAAARESSSVLRPTRARAGSWLFGYSKAKHPYKHAMGGTSKTWWQLVDFEQIDGAAEGRRKLLGKPCHTSRMGSNNAHPAPVVSPRRPPPRSVAATASGRVADVIGYETPSETRAFVRRGSTTFLR